MVTKHKDTKIIHIKSWEDIPPDACSVEDIQSGTKALADSRKRIVYVKTDAPKDQLEHELYHVKKRHAGYPRSPEKYVQQEVDANIHTYKTLKKPKGIKRRIRFVALSLNKDYGVPLDKGVAIVKKALKKDKNTPQRWIRDATLVGEEVKQSYRQYSMRGKRNLPYFCTKCKEWHMLRDNPRAYDRHKQWQYS